MAARRDSLSASGVFSALSALPASLALGVAVIAAGCGPAVPEYTLVQAANGSVIKLERKSRVRVGDTEVALKLAYRTDLPIDNAANADDAAALRAEVEEVWRSFQAEAEAAGLEMALIEARALRGERWSRIGRSQRFAFRKSKTGSWELVEREAARTTAVKAL